MPYDTDTLPDPMHAAERACTLIVIEQMEALLVPLSSGADAVLGSRRDFDALVSDIGDLLERCRDEVRGQ
jgi:hypothetical protein